MMNAKFLLLTDLVLDDEGIVDAVVVNEGPYRLQLGPDPRAKVILDPFKEPWANGGKRDLVSWNWIKFIGCKSTGCLGCLDQ